MATRSSSTARGSMRASAACRPARCAVVCQASAQQKQQQRLAAGQRLAAAAASAFAAASLLAAAPALAEFRMPPLDSDPNRCDRGYVGNTIGQANAVSDKLLDLRKCVYAGKNLSGKTLAGALLSEADLSGANLQEAVLTKAYANASNFEGADMTNAVVDRVSFDKANMRKTVWVNAVVTGSTFEGADLTESNWEGALIGNEDVKRLCANPTLLGDSRVEVGCRVVRAK